MNCHKVLNLDVSRLISDKSIIPRPAKYKPLSVVGCDPKHYLTDHTYNKLSVLGKLNSLVFHMKPYVDKGNIHIDMNSIDIQPFWPSLNIIIEGQGIMKWFAPTSQGTLRYNPFGKVWYYSWEKNFGDVVDQWTEGKVALVRTDIPHNAWNPVDEERLVVSIRWKQRYSWEETVNWFEKNFSQ